MSKMNEQKIKEKLDLLKQYSPSAQATSQAIEKVRDALFSEQTEKQTRKTKLWSFIMKSNIAKLSAAAMIVIAAIIGLSIFNGTSGSVALADVLAKAEQVRAFMYRMRMDMNITAPNNRPNKFTGETQNNTTILFSEDYGIKMSMRTTDPNGKEITAQQMYMIPNQSVMVMVMPKQKKYMRMKFSEDLMKKMKNDNNDPREAVKKMLDSSYVELGRATINGVECEGFETTDPKFMAGMADNVKVTLWVGVKSQLPVYMEMDIKVNEQMQMHCVIDDYQWDVQVNASEFEPVIPEDYTEMVKGGIELPTGDEASAIEGLQFFADITGSYPKNLNMMTLMQEIQKSKNFTAAGKKFKQEMKQLEEKAKQLKKDNPDKQMSKELEGLLVKKIMKIMKPIQSLGIFYMTLVQQKKDPAYYGDVSPDDSEHVLLRWKLSEGTYRVIFGNLSARDVTADELTRLESR